MIKRLYQLRTPEEPLRVVLTRAVGEAEQVARAEIDFQKARLFAKLALARTGAVLAVGALVLVSLALIALVVGLLLILQAALGPVWATVIVVVVLAAASGLLAWMALRDFTAAFGASENKS